MAHANGSLSAGILVAGVNVVTEAHSNGLHIAPSRLPARAVWVAAGIGAFFIIGLCAYAAWVSVGRPDYTQIEAFFVDFLQNIKGSPLAGLWTVFAFVMGGLVFFPVTVMTMAAILVFGGWYGFLYAMLGASLSSIAGYGIGRMIGRARLERVFGRAKVFTRKLSRSGVIGVILVRMMPMPFSLVNMLFGAAHMPVATFFAGSTLSMLPGKVMMALFGASLLRLLQNPAPGQLVQVGGLLVLWLSMVVVFQYLARKWQKDHPIDAA